jgi:hypothetical protein
LLKIKKKQNLFFNSNIWENVIDIFQNSVSHKARDASCNNDDNYNQFRKHFPEKPSLQTLVDLLNNIWRLDANHPFPNV